MKARVVITIALLAAHAAIPAFAQDGIAEQERALRARVAEDEAAGRTGSGARCELGFVLVRGGRAEEAIAELDRAIAELGEPSDRALRARLGACLYNRGRAAEEVRDLAGAREAYRRSLALRPNATVQARLDALPPESSEEIAGRAALELCRSDRTIEHCEVVAARAVVGGEAAASGEPSWSIVETRADDGANPCHGWHAVAVQSGAGRASTVYAYCNQNEEDVRVTTELRALEGVGRSLVARFASEWPDSGDAPAGGVEGIVVVWPGARGLAAIELTTRSDAPRFALDVEIDGAGQLVITRVEGAVPRELRRYLGRHTAEELRRLRP